MDARFDACPANGMTVRGVSVACLTMVQQDVLNRDSKKAADQKLIIGEIDGSSDS